MLKYKTIVAVVLATTAFAVHAESSLNVRSGPQPAPYWIANPAPTPADFRFAVIPQDVWFGPQATTGRAADPAPTPANFKFAVIPQAVWN